MSGVTTAAPTDPAAPRWVSRLLPAAGATLAVVMLGTLATLLAGFALKSYCLTSWEPGRQPKSCYNDFQTLWYQRDMGEHVAPYQGEVESVYEDGHLTGIKLGAGQIEYPVLTGVFAWVTALPVDGHAGYLIVSALALSPFAFLTSLALRAVSGGRALLFALSPQLAAYAFLNWDLLPVAATAGAVWAWYRGRPVWTAVLLSLGACAKIWPGFLLLPLLIHLLLAGRHRDAGRVFAAAGVTAAAVNLPFLFTNPEGWFAPYRMQSLRLNDLTTNSHWQWLFGETAFSQVNAWSAVSVLAGWAAILVVGYRRRQEPEGYPWLAVGAAMVCSYIILGRVDSPQYGLWLAPFLVLLAVPTRWLVAFAVTDMFLWLQWSWMWGAPNWLLYIAMTLRGLTLVGLTVVLLRSRPYLTAAVKERRAAGNPLASTQTSTAPVTQGATN